MISTSPFIEAAQELSRNGFHVFALDHPKLPQCIGQHRPGKPCDGHRGKHPAVKWSVFTATETPPQMVETVWDNLGGGACNIGIACGPSGVVVLDEDAPGELDRWCEAYGIELPDTYIVTTGRGRHLYFLWDHSEQPIGNGEKAMAGFKINVRGAGGFVVGEGSQHETGSLYLGNRIPMAPLPSQVARMLLAAQANNDQANGSETFSDAEAFLGTGGNGDPNSTPIPAGSRHAALVSYAGRLRAKGMDLAEATVLFEKRWQLCEQPEGNEKPWDVALAVLTDVYQRYEAGEEAPTGPGQSSTGSADSKPKLWRASALRQAEQPTFLAKNRIPRAAITILIGEEGIGKSLLWVHLAAAVTTGKPLPEFGIPATDPADIVLILTEDEWSSVVLPRLTVAGADINRVHVICAEDDGSGSPTFPDDMHLITGADVNPAMVVCDAWLDTVPVKTRVGDPQQSRQVLHPWKEMSTKTGAASLLVTHANRMESGNIRDKYGATASLRQKARMTLYCLADKTGTMLIVGPDKSNGTSARTKASQFRITAVPRFQPTADHDGTVPKLAFAGESDKTIKEHLAEQIEQERSKGKPPSAAELWLREFLTKHGAQKAADIYLEAEMLGFSKDQLKRAKANINKSATVRVHTFRPNGTTDGPWYWELQQTDVGV